MKALCLFIAAIFFISATYAQSTCTDTNNIYLDRATGLVNYSTDTGYVIGTNRITEAVGDYFTVAQGKLTGVLIWFGAKVIANPNDSFNVYVFNINPIDTLPIGAAIDSGKIAGSDIDTTFDNNPINWTYVQFNHPVTVTNEYAIVIQTYYGDGVNVGDTISIFGDNQGDGGSDPGTIMLAGNGEWYGLGNVWVNEGAPFDVDAMMSPILDQSFYAAATSAQTATCPGSLINLGTTAYSCSGIASYQWSGPGINNPYDETTTAIVPSNQTDSATYSVMVIDSANDTLIKSVTIPVKNISVTAGNDTTISCGDYLTLIASASGYTGAGTIIQWQNGPSSLEYPNVGPGTYTVSITNSTGCTASATVQVSSTGNNVVSFSIPSSGCTDSTINFTNTSTYTGGWQWDWNFGDGVGNSLASCTHAYLESGQYSVSLTGDSGGCRLNSATVSITINNCGGTFGICNADSTVTQSGIYPASSLIPCIVDGQAYNTTLTYRSFTSIDYSGNTVVVDSVKIDSINNLPCGISWECNNSPGNTYSDNELGCIKLSGTTNDSTGQYKLDIIGTFYLSALPGQGLQEHFSIVGIQPILRVIPTAGTNCATVDTFLAGNTSSCSGSNFNPLTIYLVGTDSICNGDSTRITAIVSGGSGSYSYTWSDRIFAHNYQYINQTGITSVTVTDDTTGYTATASVNITYANDCGSLVWPGDANDDGQVDYRDVLQIALINGSSGPARVNASIQWVGQVASNWDGITNGLNDKYGDCDGNGIINFNDTLAVTQNYGLTHNKTGAPKPSPTDPVLTFAPESDTIVADSLFKIMILLGTPSNSVDSLYGLGFSMAFNPAIFDTNSIQLAANESWLGNSALTFRKWVNSEGQLVMVISATNQLDILGGNGLIGELTLRAQPVLPYVPGNSYSISPTAMLGITTSGTTRTFNTQPFPVSIISGISNVQMDEDISVYPNPNSGHFQLTMNEPSKQLTIQLLNIEGMILYTEQLKDVPSVNKDYDFNTLAKGVYLLKMSNENGVVVKRLVVQ